MGMIKRADIEGYTRDAYVMDLSDLEKRGNALIDAANTKATQIISDAQRERELLVNKAQEQGHAEGYEAGHREGYEQGLEQGVTQTRAEQSQLLEQLAAMWTEQLGYFEQRRDAMLEAARVQVVELAAAIAQRVVRRVIELDPSVVCDQLESVLSSVTENTRLIIRVHPDDAERVREELPKLVDRFASCEHAQVVTDPSLQSGSCVASTAGGGVIDSSIATQLDRIVSSLLPAEHPRHGAMGLHEHHDPDAEDSEETGEIDERKGDAA